MTVSIIICTRNRADSLRETLASINQATVPDGWSVELVVVDNGSTDHTAQVVRCASLPQITKKYVVEPQAGKSHAYNAGLSSAAGEVLLCTDDDVRVPTHWIEGMCQQILKNDADAVAGGVLFPDYIAGILKKHLPDCYHGWFASSHDIDPLGPDRMVGANMAFHRRVLEKVSGFDIELGPGPGGLGNFEDTLFSWQVMAAGFKLAAALDVAVEHHFDITRLKREHLMNAARNMGRSHAFVFHHWQHQRSRLVIPRLILCQLRHRWLRLLGQNETSTDNRGFSRLLDLQQELAFYREYLAQRRQPFKYARHGSVPPAAAAPEKSESGDTNPPPKLPASPVAQKGRA